MAASMPSSVAVLGPHMAALRRQSDLLEEAGGFSSPTYAKRPARSMPLPRWS